MSTTTPNLSLVKPAKTTDTTWWSMLNGDMDIIDALFASATRASGSIVYYNSSNKFATDVNNLSWDDVAKGVVIGGVALTAGQKLDVRGNIMIRTTGAPQLSWHDGSSAADNRWWSAYAFSNTLVHQLVNDAGTVTTQWLQVVRSGLTVSEINFTTGGVTVGGPTGGSKGTGTVNVSSNLYKNNVAYTSPDFVFEHYFHGRVEKFKESEGAADYTGLWPLEKTEAHVREHWRFPFIKDEPTGIFTMADISLRLHEETYLHLFEINRRLKKLEGRE